MKKKSLSLLIFVFFFAISFEVKPSYANSVFDSVTKVKETLLLLSGCFEVQFQFVEDGLHDKIYSPIFEWIRLKSQSESENSQDIILEHIGVYPLNENLPVTDLAQEFFVQYHWREHWHPISSSIWKTFVYGPYIDSPKRYECEGVWLKGQFTCKSNALKPRRHNERDYDYLRRKHSLQVNAKRWIQSEQNRLMKYDGTVVATELGWVTYNRVDNHFCKEAIEQNPQPF